MTLSGPARATGLSGPQLRNLLQALAGTCLLLSPTFAIVAMSRDYAKMAGADGGNTGGSPLDVLPDPLVAGSPVTLEVLKASLNRVLSTGTADTVLFSGTEVRFQTGQEVVTDVPGMSATTLGSNPQEKSWAMTNTPLINQDGSVVYILHSLLEMKVPVLPSTEMAGMEEKNQLLAEQLRASENRFRELLEGASDAVLEIDSDGIILVANQAAISMFGFNAEELIGAEVETLLVPGPGLGAHREHRRKFNQNPHIRRMGSGLELSANKKDGSIFPAEISLIPVWSHDKSHVITIVHDITARKRIEEKLHQAQKLEALGRLAGGTAHEFNNLLAIIVGSAELILVSPGSRVLTEKNADRIRAAAMRGGGLARQLLSFGRQQLLSARAMDLNVVLREMSDSFADLLGATIKFEIRYSPEPAWVVADRLHMEQVITNLLLNARDAMQQGGRISLATQPVEFGPATQEINPGLAAGRYILLSVADNGKGMTPEVEARIFEPFFSIKGLAEAHGMGLSTTYGIITQSGGTITVKSQLGVGTIFDIYLPRATDQELLAEENARRSAGSISGNETILLLEDQPELLMLTTEFLRQNGYRVLPERSGSVALQRASTFQGTIDLVITDVVMPGMNGREFTEKLKATHPGVPVLYVSGYTDEIFAGVALDADDSFMAKPFANEELGVKIREMLEKSKKRLAADDRR